MSRQRHRAIALFATISVLGCAAANREQSEANTPVSRRFTHLFQLKAVGGQDSQPIITISGAKRREQDGLEVRHSALRASRLLHRSG